MVFRHRATPETAGGLLLPTGFGQLGMQHGHGGFHGFPCRHQVRQEGFAATKGISDLPDTDPKALVDAIQRFNPLSQGPFG